MDTITFRYATAVSGIPKRGRNTPYSEYTRWYRNDAGDWWRYEQHWDTYGCSVVNVHTVSGEKPEDAPYCVPLGRYQAASRW